MTAMFPYKKVMQILVLCLVITLLTSLVIDAVRQYKYVTSQQCLIDAAHESLVPVTVHTIHVRSPSPGSPWSDPSTESLTIDVKKAMQNRSRQEGTVLNASYNLSVPRKFVFRKKKSVRELFDLMLDNRGELEQLCVDGIHRLEGYVTYGYGLNSLIQVAGIIKGFDRLLDNIRAKDPWVLDVSAKKYWLKFVALLTRLLTMYLIIGNDQNIKKTCAKLIGKMVLQLDQAMGWILQGAEAVLVAIPWLLNLLHSKDPRLGSDVRSQKFKDLAPVLDDRNGRLLEDDLMAFEGFYKNLYQTFRSYAAA